MRDEATDRSPLDRNGVQAPVLQLTLHELIDAQTARVPGAVALAEGRRQVTYAELAARTDRLAARLRGRGVGPETVVGVCGPRSASLIVALLGVMKAGGAFLPMDPDLPADHAAFRLADAGCRLIVATGDVDGFGQAGTEVVRLDRVEQELAAEPGDALPRAAVRDNLACVIYTSDTTGRPKGVEVTHGQLVNYFSWLADRVDLTGGRGVPLHSTIDSNGTVPALFAPLVAGNTLRLVPDDGEADGLARFLDDERDLSLLTITPAKLDATTHRLTDGIPDDAARVVVLADEDPGRPDEMPRWRDADVHVLDEDMRPVAPGAVGELYVGGPVIARGYRGRPGLTAAAFVPHPFRAGARLYRTGDLVRQRSSGDLEFMGRVDDQVKIRGFRVEPGEIQAVVQECPGVRQAVVDVRADASGGRRVVAYLVPDAAEDDDLAASQVGQWQKFFDDTATRVADDERFNLAGPTSSFDGLPLSDDQMRARVDATVARIGRLAPSRVLEIGCGTGLLTWRIAPGCERYVGTDLSPATVAGLGAALEKAGVDNVTLFACDGLRTAQVAGTGFDTVIINSVTQYFPGQDYLEQVLNDAIAVMAGSGTVFVGDVRSLPLLGAHHLAVALARSSDSSPLRHLEGPVRRSLGEERELAVAPAYFADFARRHGRVSHCEVLPKRGRMDDELTRFRYDVILHVGETQTCEIGTWLDWNADRLSPQSARELLESHPAGVGIKSVPNARVNRPAHAFQLLLDGAAGPLTADDLERRVQKGVDPEDIWALEAELPCSVHLSWSRGAATGDFDVALVPSAEAGSVLFPQDDLLRHRPLTNDPLAARRVRARARDLTAAARTYARERLPEPMVPSAFVVVGEVPLTANGKVDWRALPEPRSALPELAPVPRDGGELVSSFAQQRLWFLDRLVPGNPFYNVSLALRLVGALDVVALEGALRWVVGRHEVLRSVFADVDGRPFQVVGPVPGRLLEVEEAADVARARLVAEREAVTLFDLASGPLLRSRLVRLGEGDHVLLLTMHHIAFDGWSRGVLLGELGECYAALAAGREPVLPELPVQYADFAVWQRSWLRGEVLAGHLDYWRDRLAGMPAAIELPFDRPRPEVLSHRGRVASFRVPAQVVAGLREVGREQNATLFMVTLAAFQALLSRYSGQQDVVVGSPIAGRIRPELKRLVGFFANTLVMRTDCSGDPSFTELLGRVREVALGAYAHQDLPFDKLVEELHEQRDLSRNPLVQVMFQLYHSRSDSELRLPGVEVGWFQPDQATVRFDVEVLLQDGSDGGLEGSFIYSVDLFDQDTMERLAGNYVALLAEVAADAARPVSALVRPSGAEAALIEGWNATRVPVPDDSVAQLFAAQALASPQALALVCETDRLTYAELNARANPVAAFVRSAGLGPDDVVGVGLPRGVDLLVVLVGVVKAGAAYLPLDPELPVERREFMIADSGCRLVIGADELVAIAGLPADEVCVPVSPDNLVYVMYTSGSTGRPKGVQVPHRAVVGLVHAGFVRFGPDRVFLHAATAAFDASTFEIWGALLHGGRCVMLPERVPTAAGLRELIAAEGVTTAWLTGSLYNQVIDADPRALAGVEQLMVGGEALSPGHVARVPEGVELVNGYGPTECTTFATTFPVAGWRAEDGPVPIGRPIGNVEAYVLDERMRPAPIGAVGELYLAGPGLARGYLGRPGLTAAAFVPHPFRAGARLYRTGDLVRQRSSGDLEFIGRVDDQVKIRGFRVEPGEIQAVIASVAGIRQAVVVTRAEEAGTKGLLAYLVSDSPAAETVGMVRAALRARLPEYMVPSAFVVVDEVPLTANGKVDWRALPEPGSGRPELGSAPVRPRSEVEEVLASIWAAVLGLDEVGVEDNFFDLGGHSLLATQVLSRVRQVLGAEVPLRALFGEPTVAGLAVAVEMASGSALPELAPVPRDGGELMSSFAQQRLWFLDQLVPGNPFYNVPLALRLEGALDVVALEGALRWVVGRHEVLRSVFADVDGRPFQVVGPVPGRLLEVEEAADVAQAWLIAEREAVTLFDLASGPLLRSRLVRLGEGDHVLLLTMHHIASDGWSRGVLLGELGECYAALAAGRQPVLPELPVQYADFAAWQASWLRGEVLAGHLDYWRDRLAGMPAAIELPLDRPRPVVPSYRGGVVRFRVPAQVVAGLRGVGREQNATLFMVTLAAFQALLSRYSGQQDVVVGSPIAGRVRPELERLVGFFVNTLVMRTDCSGDPSFTELLGRVREVALGAYAHQDLPFEKLVEELHEQRDLSRNPLVQVMFQLYHAPGDWELRLPGVEVGWFQPDQATVRFDVEVLLQDGPDGGLEGSFIYSVDLFDQDTMERLAGNYAALLAQVAADAARPVSALVRPSGAEAALIEGWNATRVPVPDDSVAQLFAAQALASPQALALVCGADRLSYGELNARANQVAAYVRAAGVGPDDVVGVCFPRGIDLVAVLVGVMKAGAAYLPLDPELPVERREFMIADSGCRLVIGADELVAIAGLPQDEVCVPVSPDNLVYVMYTSGSTGRPKGVAIPHRSVTNALTWINHLCPMAADDAMLQKAPATFDVSVAEIFQALMSGARLIIAEPHAHADLPYLVELIRTEKVTDAHFVPSMLELFLTELGDERCPSLKRIIAGGEALSTSLAEWFHTRLDAALFNLYGPTEALTGSIHPDQRANDGTSVPIGRPIGNVEAYVLDERMRPAPIGAVGELYLGGFGLARGYLGRPGLTAAAFVPHPFRAGARLYRTGDLVRQRSNGDLEYLSRVDDQVKIRGFRIEPGEIQAVVQECPGVRQAVVGVRADASGEHRVMAYLVPDADAAEDLLVAARGYARARLPEYMVPSAFMVVDEVPLTANGKVDWRALPEPGSGRPELGSAPVRPRSEVEEVLASIWAAVLGLDEVGVFDDFFDLGGHSLLATQVMSRVREVLGAEVPLRTLFEEPTVAGLAAAVTAASGTASALPQLAPVPRDGGELVLSFAQQRLWFLDRLVPGNPFYNVSLALRLEGALDVVALEGALRWVVGRHEVLRSVFADVDGRPFQVVGPVPERLLEVEEAADVARARLVAEREAVTLFDLASGPLLRSRLVRLGEGDHVLLLTTHHIVSDGWSWGVLLGELGECYAALAAGRQPVLPELPVQYADFAAWQRSWLRGEVLAGHLDYWRDRLAGMPAGIELPLDRPRPVVPSYRGGVVRFRVPAQVVAGLRAVGREQNATLFMVTLAAFQALLSRYSGQQDVVVGSPIAGRIRPELERLVGFFANTLVMRTDCSGDPSFTELLTRVREAALGAYAHQDLPFEKLVEELQEQRDLSRHPLFQVVFQLMQPQHVEIGRYQSSFWTLELPDVEVKPLTGVAQRTSRCDLEVLLAEGPESGIDATVIYPLDLFDGETVERLMANYLEVLRRVSVAPGSPVSVLAQPSVGEQALLRQWNATRVPVPDDSVAQLFAAQALASPQALALVCGADRLSYGELNARANQVAAYVRAAGIGPDDVVGVCFPRGIDLVAVLVGVVKAGAAYLPLDPELPVERREFMIADSGCRLVIGADELVAIAGLPADEVCVPVSPDNLVYVMYTSGSTGRPKGVQVPHRAVVGLVHAGFVRFGPDRVFLHAATAAFDASTFEIWGALLHGGRCVVFPERVPTAATLGQVIRAEQVTTACLTTSLYNQVIDADPQALAGIEQLMVGGEALSPGHVARVPEGVELVNGYGPTECTTFATTFPVAGWRAEDGPVPIGRPIGNVEAYVLDERMRPAPIGAVGELYLAGPGLARGYLGRPGLTAAAFVPHPFQTGARLYRTGDLVRQRSSGDLEFIGRVDDQVKIRGFRVEPGEIQAVIASVAGIRQAVVVARAEEAGTKGLLAYLVSDSPAAETVGMVRAALRARLPEYMVPSAFVVVDEVPLTANGKVDWRALPEPGSGRPELGSAPVRPRSEVEEVLASIWAAVLGLDEVGVEDNFFDLGGHSLLAAEVVGVANDQGLPVTLVDMFEHQTIAAIAARLRESGTR
ncbi:amino acid adenylation domain-containing protein [Nonomuraea sp. NPDC001831]|uniref:amino acid adenylation domain-containing protein n=1 Tax=Nonomuraea sp. NPDC001831 TaxID=3364340 RepID=UPI0036BD6453